MAARFGARNRMGRHLFLYHTWGQVGRKGKSSNNSLSKTEKFETQHQVSPFVLFVFDSH